MTFDFTEKETAVKKFVETKLPEYFESAGIGEIDGFVDDFLDFDKYKKNTVIFYDFESYNFGDLTNESNESRANISLRIALRGAAAESLRDKLRIACSAVYQMSEDNGGNFGGIYDFGKITQVSFFNAANGNASLKVARIDFECRTEI